MLFKKGKINPWLFPRTYLFQPNQQLISQLCRFEELDSDNFRYWISKLREPWRRERKLWELGFISQALYEKGMLQPDKKGLGFAIGKEKLPALFASMGCHIVATDLPESAEDSLVWQNSDQHLTNLDVLNRDGICDPNKFAENVSIRRVDMNYIPDDLESFDFTWSTCSFEHCGSLELGLDFIENQMKCLKPGGIAVHTTEFNLSSNRKTIKKGITSIYRKRDIKALYNRLKRQHIFSALDFRIGQHPSNFKVDLFPYSLENEPSKIEHLRLAIDQYACTSIGLIIQKK
jgi:SAM-dependent methyltransferase